MDRHGLKTCATGSPEPGQTWVDPPRICRAEQDWDTGLTRTTGDVIVVPEPGTALLGVIGALAALASRRGMRRRSFV